MCYMPVPTVYNLSIRSGKEIHIILIRKMYVHIELASLAASLTTMRY